MERTFVPTDSKGAYLKSELDSEALLYLRDPAESCGTGILNANPTSAPTVVGVTEAGSDTGTAATEADRVCSAKDTREMADGLQIAGTNISGAHALSILFYTRVPIPVHACPHGTHSDRLLLISN